MQENELKREEKRSRRGRDRGGNEKERRLKKIEVEGEEKKVRKEGKRAKRKTEMLERKKRQNRKGQKEEEKP
uniref:Uncharacterized protein n=1 Tax=Octopus bimaculoides TaxID=37653 RepID=A0A0L8FXS0_OCTBM